ncbi:BTB domain-containing protein [Phanerochaete sordida]|uniref:BTB domain-containing protein n=1 Tax=Phanerochaete sordida TaxID=48140 RepID=A0A9P3GDK3_9APHY|nr:BTB domain-containing protein [Phanerochaete sordida]
MESMQERATLVRSEEVWFDDGNIVLQAEGTLFKVYRGILSRESPFFRDMFSLPQTVDTVSDCYDGCPIIAVHDSPNEMKKFLSATHNYETHFNGHFDCVDYVIILRLATKYQAETLRRRIIEILQYVYPDSLDGFDKSRLAGAHFPATHPLHKLSLGDLSTHVAVINAANDRGASVLLPSAMVRVLVKGIDFVVNDARAAPLERTSRDAVLGALPALSALARQHTFEVLFRDACGLSDQCMQIDYCDRTRRQLVRTLENPALAHVISPFHIIGFGSKSKHVQNLCPDCRAALKKCYEAGRRQAWEKLPAVFGLPEWDELRRRAKESDIPGEPVDAPMDESEVEEVEG